PMPAHSPSGLQFHPCTLASKGLPFTVTAQCSQLSVPLDRSRPDGKHIDLAIARITSNAKRPRPDPVFMLAGGPGQSARESYPGVSPAFRDILRDRDLILVDQRGTGGSHPLDCKNGGPEAGPGATSADAARKAAARCLAQLDVDPTHFTTTDAIADLDAVRAALGAERINLVGVSYGTRVALEYLRRHPEHTRAIVLDGVVPPTLV